VKFDGINVNQQDGNCYLSNTSGGRLPGSIGFIMLMAYCWIVWSSIVYAIYSIKNSQDFGKSRYWRKLFFDDVSISNDHLKEKEVF